MEVFDAFCKFDEHCLETWVVSNMVNCSAGGFSDLVILTCFAGLGEETVIWRDLCQQGRSGAS